MRKTDILNMNTVAYYSGLNGLEIKDINDDMVLCVSGAWNGKHQPHKVKLYYNYAKDFYYFMIHGYKIPLNECIRTGI